MSQSTAAKTDKADQNADEQPPLWNLIPLAEFKPPSSPAPEAVRSGLRDLWRRLRGGKTTNNGEENAVEMVRPSQKLLDWAAPAPDWRAEDVAGLSGGLKEWLQECLGGEDAGAGVHTLVEPPIATVSERLESWAAEQGYFVVTPPTPDQILGIDGDWLDALPLSGGQRLLLPRLERCFLRHHDGLELLRRLLDRIDQFQPPLLVICQSWAWRYLCQVEKIDALLGAPLTPAPFGDEELDRWLCDSARDASPYEFIFREGSNGARVLGTDDPESADQPKPSSFLKNLAARSRGNPRLAWEIWRGNLLASKDSAVEEGAQEAAKEDKGFTLWVRPWEQVQLPDLAGDASSLDAMVLYTLLQHGGLAQRILPQLLPFASSEIVYALHRLRRVGVVCQERDEWKLTALGYPGVRRFLTEEGYLIDEL